MKTTTTTTNAKIAITECYEARRDRKVHPEGKFDSAGRWYPSSSEGTPSVRSPSRAWPYSYLLACRTRRHVAGLVAAYLAGDQDLPSDVVAACRRAGLVEIARAA